MKRAAQLETVLHKVKSEVDFRVEQAVTRRLSLEVEDQTTVERHRAERAEEELKQLKEALLNKDREIDYLQGAKKIWQKRAKVRRRGLGYWGFGGYNLDLGTLRVCGLAIHFTLVHLVSHFPACCPTFSLHPRSST